MPVTEAQKTETMIPEVNDNYIPFGNYDDLVNVIASGQFYPVWISGLSGNGKTLMVEQACANTNREFYRVNFTTETDESDLLGHWSIQNGETVFEEGPVVRALRAGAILLLDEVDLGSTKVMCLQSVMEGKGVLLKQTGEWVKPSPGFNVIATSNTKGRGDTDDGRFMGANVMNAAFIDRFAGMMFQDYPPKDVEMNILSHVYVLYHFIGKNVDPNTLTDEFMTKEKTILAKLTDWAYQIRQTFAIGGCEEVITTRTLVNIVQGYAIFGDVKKAIALACERYNDATKEAFISIFEKMNDDFVVAGDEFSSDEDSNGVTI